MKVVIGTRNNGKIKVVESVFRKYFDGFSVESIEADSRVRDLPLSDEEMIEGAMNRAREGVKKGDYGVGIEGGIDRNRYGTFLLAWAVIIDKKGNIGIGCGPRIKIPKKIDSINEEKDLIRITESLSGKKHEELKQDIGLIGLLSKGRISRMDNLRIALEHALIQIR